MADRPFPSSKIYHFQSKAKCEAIDMKMIFNYDANKTHFHNKGFELNLVLKVRFFGTRKWPIFSLSLIIVPELFAKVNSSQFPFVSKRANSQKRVVGQTNTSLLHRFYMYKNYFLKK